MEQPTSSGRDRLAKVQRDSDARNGQGRLAASNAQAELQRREERYAAASGSFGEISGELFDAVRHAVPSVDVFADLPPAAGSWRVEFMGAAMRFDGPSFLPVTPLGHVQDLAFDVIATCECRKPAPPG